MTEKTAIKNVPPDKEKFANVLKKNDLIRKNHCDLPEIKSRWFNCRIRRKSFEEIVMKQFKHVKVCAYQFTRYDKRKYLALNVGFDISSAEGKEEYENAKELRLPSGTVIKAVPDEKLNGNQYLPRPPQKIYLDCVPYDVFQERDQLASALLEFVEFYESDMWEWICENGVYTGKVSVEVKTIKKKPPRDLEISFGEQTVKLWTLTRGLNPKVKVETDAVAATTLCHSCKKIGHLSKDCEIRKNRIFSWKCTTCGGNSYHTRCRVGICKFAEMEVIVGNAKDTIEKSQSVSDGDATMHQNTIMQIARKVQVMKNMKKPRSMKDKNFEINRLRAVEMSVIRHAIRNCCTATGLLDFPAKFDKKWKEVSGIKGNENMKTWYDRNKEKLWEENTFTIGE